MKCIKHEKSTLVAKSRNDMIEVSDGEYIFFIDDNSVVEKDTIEKLVKFMDSRSDVGTAAPVTCYYSELKFDVIFY